MIWTLLTTGYLSRNKFWGESDQLSYRPVLATSTLIQDGQTNILIDPSLPIEQMNALLQRHANITVSDIHMVYITHYHADHRVDALLYPHASCFISEGTFADMQTAIREKDPQAPVNIADYQVINDHLIDGINLLPLPGHTPGLTGLAFESNGHRILLTGDAVMDEGFFRHGEGYWFDKSPEISAKTIAQITQAADIVIPGHGDWFRTADYSPSRKADLPYDCRLLTGPSGEKAYLLQHQGRYIIVDPFLPASQMIQALFMRSGLYPVQISALIFSRDKASQPQIAALFPNAQSCFIGTGLPDDLTEDMITALIQSREISHA